MPIETNYVIVHLYYENENKDEHEDEDEDEDDEEFEIIDKTYFSEPFWGSVVNKN